jgi:hypothetical protein
MMPEHYYGKSLLVKLLNTQVLIWILVVQIGRNIPISMPYLSKIHAILGPRREAGRLFSHLLIK